MDGGNVPTASERRDALKIVGITVVAMTFLATDVTGLMVHGGLWSLVSGLRAADAHVPVVDVDSAGLRSIVTAGTCLVLFGVFSLLNLDIRRRGPAIVVLLSMVGGSLTLNALSGEPIIDYVMAAHGYQRRFSGDHTVGSGRSKVSFNEFVMTSSAGLASSTSR